MTAKHTIGIYIILLFMLVTQSPIVILPALVSSPILAIIVVAVILGYAILILKQTNTRIKNLMCWFPSLIASLGLLLSAISDTALSVTHWIILGIVNTLIWFVIISIYTAKSKAYKECYKSNQSKVSGNIKNQDHHSLSVELKKSTIEDNQYKVSKENVESTREIVSLPQVLMVVVLVLTAFIFLLFTQIKG